MVLAATALPLLASPWWSAEHRCYWFCRVVEPAFLAFALLAVTWRIDRIELRHEQGFWRRLSFSLGALLAAKLTPLLAPTFAVAALVELFRGVSLVALFLALDGNPHRSSRRDAPPGEDFLRRVLLVLILVGYLAYFTWIPLAIGGVSSTASGGVPPFHAVLDLVALGWLVFLTTSSTTPRWRGLLGLLAASRGLVMLADLPSSGLVKLEVPWAPGALSSLAWVLLVAMAGYRHRPFERLTEPLPEPERSFERPVSIGLATLYLTLAFPGAHILLYAADLLAEAHRGAREILVALWLPLIALVAFQQHWTLRRYGRQQLERRARVSTALQQSHANLRLMSQKQEAAMELRKAEERFSVFFDISPTALLILAADEGRILEVNDSLCQLLRRPAEALVGSTGGDRLLWAEPEEMAAQLARCAEGRPIHRRQVTLRPARGRDREVLLSAVAIEAVEGPAVLVVLRDVTPLDRAQRALADRRRWLAEAVAQEPL